MPIDDESEYTLKIIDRDALWRYILEHLEEYPDVRALLQRLADEAAQQRRTLPGLATFLALEVDGAPSVRICKVEDVAKLYEICVHLGELPEIASRLPELVDRFLNHQSVERSAAVGFVLGVLIAEEHRYKALTAGSKLIEGREVGRPLAVKARLQQGKLHRRAIVDAASKLYDEDESLRRNVSKTAKIIEKQKIGALRKPDGTYLGSEAIVKHLREARKARRV